MRSKDLDRSVCEGCEFSQVLRKNGQQKLYCENPKFKRPLLIDTGLALKQVLADNQMKNELREMNRGGRVCYTPRRSHHKDIVSDKRHGIWG